MLSLPWCDFVLWYLFRDKVKPSADIFDKEEGDLFKEKPAALPEDTVNQTDENKARAKKKVSQREGSVRHGVGQPVLPSATQRDVLCPFTIRPKNL